MILDKHRAVAFADFCRLTALAIAVGVLAGMVAHELLKGLCG